MKNYTKISVGQDARTELHDQLGLTGAEISVNNLPAGAGVPFVHYHHKNEEIYMILSGRGQAILDGETVALNAGDWLRIAPETRRQFSAAADERGRLAAHRAGDPPAVLRGGGFRDQLHLHPGQGKFSGRVHGCRRDDRAVIDGTLRMDPPAISRTRI